jgi:hypothetical protein
LVGVWREGDGDGVVGVDLAAAVDGGHDAATAGLLCGARERWAPEVLLEAGAEGINLGAGGAKAGDFEDGCGTDVEEGVEGEGEEVDALGEEVFAQLAGGKREALGGELGEEFGGEEMDLGEVGGGWGFALEVEVLGGAAAVSVVLDAFVGDEGERGLRQLGEAVGGVGGGGEDFHEVSGEWSVVRSSRAKVVSR